ncbi:YlxR family protein, partial [Candidatus Entotheonella palauensis]|uniref:YlxR family protein n=1 Tax=Candidatus Entotheonella palauensis TaxID=93172 RepID=UPI0011781A4B
MGMILSDRMNHKHKPVKRARRLPERTCIGCRTHRQTRELLRLACTPQGEVFTDGFGRGPGRGAYVCFDATCIRKALHPSKLKAAFKQPVMVPSESSVQEVAVQALRMRLGSYLSMAQKAGVAISGAVPLQRALAQRRIAFLVLAEDIAAARAQAYDAWCQQQDIPWLTLFSKADLGRLLGKSSRSAVGLTQMR